MSSFHSTSSVKVGGSEYKLLSILAIKPAKGFEDPSFGQVKDIFIIDGTAYFYVRVLDVIEYSEHYCAFITRVSSAYTLVQHANLGSHLPFQAHKLSSYPNCLCFVSKFIIR